MITQSVSLDHFQSSWSDEPGYEQLLVNRIHHSGELIELPVARIRGAQPGPFLTAVSYTHLRAHETREDRGFRLGR